MGTRCFHLALLGLTRTIMTARYAFGRCEIPGRFWRGSSFSMPTVLWAGCRRARPAARGLSARAIDWLRCGGVSAPGLQPFHRQCEYSRASAEFVRGAFRRPMGAAETSDRTRPILPGTLAHAIPYRARA